MKNLHNPTASGTPLANALPQRLGDSPSEQYQYAEVLRQFRSLELSLAEKSAALDEMEKQREELKKQIAELVTESYG